MCQLHLQQALAEFCGGTNTNLVKGFECLYSNVAFGPNKMPLDALLTSRGVVALSVRQSTLLHHNYVSPKRCGHQAARRRPS